MLFLFPTVQGWSFSDVMFVTKHNMANAVATVSKQLENVSETLAVSSKIGLLNFSLMIFSAFLILFCYQNLQSTKRHLTKRLEGLDWKMELQMETSKLIADNVGNPILFIHQIIL